MNFDDMSFENVNVGITIRKTELEAPKTSVLKKLGGVYDEFAKLVFCFDVSGSMSDHVAADKNQKGFADQYKWTPAVMTKIRGTVAEVLGRILNGDVNFSYRDQEVMKMFDAAPGPNGEPLFTADDEEVKARVIQKNLLPMFNVQIDWTKPHLQPPSRIDLVKKLAKREIEARFEKYPNSKLGVVAFGEGAKTVFDSGSADDVRKVLDRIAVGMDGINSGGTTIMASLKAAMECCRTNPSPVGLHHFIVVSDGGDEGTRVLPEWVPILKQSGVVLDYIHIGDQYANEPLKLACEALGGEFVVVNTELDFERKFVEAVHRLMIPAPAGQ